MTYREQWGRAIVILGMGLCSVSAQAGKSYDFEGVVTAIGIDSITLKNGEQVLEFERDTINGISRDLQGVQIGDQLVIWYSLNAHKAKLIRKGGQQPGQAAPSGLPDLENFKRKGIIQDDRAFYDARNEVKPVMLKIPTS